MAIDFSAIPQAAYAGAIVSEAINRFGRKGTMVSALIDWSQYNAGTLGVSSVSFAVVINFLSSGRVPTPFNIASLYVDNLQSVTPIYVFFPDTGNTVTVQPDAEGWFPVMSNAAVCWVIALNLEPNFLPLTRVSLTDIFITPYTNIAVPQVAELRLASPVINIGGGAPLSQVIRIASGSWYNSAAMSISGGGGSNATVTGTLNSNGQFNATFTLTNPGSGYTGIPVITATGSQTAPTAWSSGSTYVNGSKVSSGGNTYVFNSVPSAGTSQSSSQLAGAGYGVGPPASVVYPLVYNFNAGGVQETGNYGWQNLHISSTPSTAIFTATLGAAATPDQIVTTGFGVPAMGDQSASYVDTMVAGVFRDNLFGTPYGQGNIILTNVYFTQLNAGTSTFAFQDSNGDILYNMAGAGVAGANLLSLFSMNQVLDATLTWRLNCSTIGTAVKLVSGFSWSYSLSV